MMVVSKKVLYSGRVQGVGFRWTAQRIVSGLEVAGYVRNLRTGEVELVLQGEQEQVDACLQKIAQRMVGYILNTIIEDQPPEGIKGFSIRH